MALLDEAWEALKMLGLLFIAADYTKCALGFVQLASMAELTIVVR